MNEEEEYCIPVKVSNATLAEPVAKKGTQWVGIDTMCVVDCVYITVGTAV